MSMHATASTLPLLLPEEVTRATPMLALIDALRRAFFGDDYGAPRRLACEMHPGVSLLAMPAWQQDAMLGVKIVTVASDRRPSIRSSYLLIDQVSGDPLAVIDGTTLTRRRTAAASALAASLLARADSRKLLLLGTGALIAPLIEAYTAVFAIDDIMIWGRDSAKAADAAADACARGHSAHVIADIGTGLGAADIVTAATVATEPLIHGRALRPGTHVDLIGAFTPAMCEADPETFRRAVVFVDSIEGALDEAGDLLQAINAGAMTTGEIAGNLSAMCKGVVRMRQSPDEITLFKSVGMAIEDLVAAALVLPSLGR